MLAMFLSVALVVLAHCFCDPNAVVRALTLSGNSLSGTIPSTIGALTGLTYVMSVGLAKCCGPMGSGFRR